MVVVAESVELPGIMMVMGTPSPWDAAVYFPAGLDGAPAGDASSGQVTVLPGERRPDGPGPENDHLHHVSGSG
jgi:hypothetical protein